MSQPVLAGRISDLTQCGRRYGRSARVNATCVPSVEEEVSSSDVKYYIMLDDWFILLSSTVVCATHFSGPM